MKKVIVILLAVVVAIAACFVLIPQRDKTAQEQQMMETQAAKEEFSSSGVHTWEDYMALSPEDREAFYEQFESMEAFEAWLASVKTEGTIPFAFEWDKSGKDPDAYTWEEYVALSHEDQERFYHWFASGEAFEKWVSAVKPEETVAPVKAWDKTGKKPNEYTWAEYQALNAEDKESFYYWFESVEAFLTWERANNPVSVVTEVSKWNKAGKEPKDYTWEEYEALSGEDQERFYQWFGSKAAFENWVASAKPKETVAPIGQWDKAGKPPREYTWEEYEALSDVDQEKFDQWFGTRANFEAWMVSVKPKETAPVEEGWNKTGKQPDQYTWEEFEGLTAQEQDQFYQWFGTQEAFEAWMTSVKPVENVAEDNWNKAGKQPDQYTWEEYQALTPEEQDTFFLWFASVEAFEQWMNAANTTAP